jgi:hypothetical protein
MHAQKEAKKRIKKNKKEKKRKKNEREGKEKEQKIIGSEMKLTSAPTTDYDHAWYRYTCMSNSKKVATKTIHRENHL